MQLALRIDPHPGVGWTEAPNHQFNWIGHSDSCLEFNTIYETNQYGFRGEDWDIAKPDGVVRIALLGDSHLEAIQVDDDQTAAQVLETTLNQNQIGTTYEVMNFGISNYGIGQYLLVYETFVHDFKPDYVVVYAAYFHFERTVDPIFSSNPANRDLSIRPVFDLDDDGKFSRSKKALEVR